MPQTAYYPRTDVQCVSIQRQTFMLAEKRTHPKVQNIKGPAIVTGPLNCLLSALGNDRRWRGFALADSVRLRRGRNAKESQRRCGQYSECFHGIILCHDKRESITGGLTPPLVLQRHTEHFNTLTPIT